MINLKYDKWDDITIEIYDKIKNIEISDNLNEEEMIDVNIKLLSILCDVDEETIINLPLTEFTILIGKTEFLKEMPKYEIEQYYEIGKGKVFEVQMNLRNLTTAQYIDFQTFIKDKDKNLKNILACFLLPKGKKYGEDYDVVDVAEYLYKNMSIAKARSIMFFFTLQYQSLTKVMLNYSIKTLKKEMKKEKDMEMKKQMETALQQMILAKSLIKNGIGSF